MKQIIQNLKSGDTILEEVPAPAIRAGYVLIQTTRSLVSLGTEKMLVEFGKGSLLAKAQAQPDKVKQVLEKIRSDGLMPTLEAVFNKLGQPLPLGYCNVGSVVAVGHGVTEFKVGDRVASNGPHAEMVCVPKNLCAMIPDNVSDEEAAFTVVGSIGLQGIRLLNPSFGEAVVVVGLGLIGLISAQILRANGCRVIGFDFDQQKVDLANSMGVIAVNPSNGTDQVKFVEQETGGVGADGVLITASSKSNEIITQSARMSRKRGRIVLVGVIGLDISRVDFYEKELSFQVSCSYGPGRYDEEYESKGQDYPIGFVRWTEKRNFEAILQSISSGQLSVDPLITERVPLKDYIEIYGEMGGTSSIASLLVYDEVINDSSVVYVGKQCDGAEGMQHENNSITNTARSNTSSLKLKTSSDRNAIGIIGAGNFTAATVLPAFKGLKANLKYIASAGGLSATTLAKKAKASHATSDYKEILKDDEIDLVMVTTRHDLHARMVTESLNAGKSVFVEKPLCLNPDELDKVEEAYQQALSLNPQLTLTIGFNRRFAPLAVKLKSVVGDGPKNIVATMNAGFIPPSAWVHDLTVGGGRIIGEACHYIDLCSYLADSEVSAVCMNAFGSDPQEDTDNASILLRYANGTNAVINYFANGSKSYSKERVEVHAQEKSFVLDNWRELRAFGVLGFRKLKSKQDKGHKAQFDLLVEQVNGSKSALIPYKSLINTTKASFAAIESLKSGGWVGV
ncbi:bi-domain-containing oxidoreductase [Desulfosediminicola ganghwensis]|uniref:bi-domain-containing oxidoreductase n=1 Tax=Desulfosediminicola ganghwensis TaxID=2569540 RepID=UPI0010ABD222|nr:bi-domain-containing oxidoreductase [Desulfosediminicola ganghwensis]